MEESKKIAAKIAVVYIVIGALWIIFSDRFSLILAENEMGAYVFFQRYKGWLFILITGFLIYILVYQRASRLVESAEKLKNKEKQLQKSNQHYQSLFHHNPDAVFEITREGKLAALNPEGEEIIGRPVDDLKGKPLDFLIHPEDRDYVKELFRKTLLGKPEKFEMNIFGKSGNNRLLRCTLLPIIVDEKIIGVFGMARDITHYRENEEMMIASEKLSVIGQLAAAVAHEIRNPLTSLKGFVQLMQVTKKADDKHLGIMLSEIERINLISGEMLILGKQQDILFGKEEVNDTIKQVIVLMEAQANLDNVGIDFAPSQDGPMFVNADQNQLKQVLINIIKNGVEAIDDHGFVKVVTAKTETQALIKVQDSGAGMDQERIDRLGEPFYSTKEKGTGLGLAVCKKIVERHQGEITYESEKGKGTTVTITLPLS
ncbi:PAS domain S-box protein [Rossellomorea vietnamensis]|uniref:histidine kinase n=1 Tax=Rossellomorea vietnamensis TaxID=218284 RepID=A0A5D4KEL3_9BACI|nr:ATP-binding protein [Rossellomorea vietnamensis]TYR75747.1 PAS domain S-box protein [Rossellomorea vietnamensis]